MRLKNARPCGDKFVARRLPYIEYSFSSRLLLAVDPCILCLIIYAFLFRARLGGVFDA